MNINNTQLQHTIKVMSEVLRFERPADAILSYYFRHNDNLGANDRHAIAEVTFAALRNLITLKTIMAPEKMTPRKVVLATLAVILHTNLKQIEGLKEGEFQLLSRLKGEEMPADLFVRAELPQWVVERLGQDEAEILKLGEGLKTAAPLDIRVNTLKAKREEVMLQLSRDGFNVAATPYSPVGIRFKGKPALNKHELFKNGVIEVQDEGSQLLGLLVGSRRGEMVVDFCAGAGGKTLLLGAQMASSGRLYAFDVSEKRLSKFKPRMAKSGLSNVHPQLIAHENDTKIKRLAGKADRVLVDAPCSGMGTLRRNPDLKFRQTPETLQELNEKQASILRSAARLLRVGGRLVYATCSILPEENEKIVEAFLADHPDFELISAESLLKEAKIDLAVGDFLKLNPLEHNTDGFFAAIMQKK